jgi:hypothetical protein
MPPVAVSLGGQRSVHPRSTSIDIFLFQSGNVIHKYTPAPVKDILRDTFIDDYYTAFRKHYQVSQIDFQTWKKHQRAYNNQHGNFIDRNFSTIVGDFSISIPEHADSWYNEEHEPGLSSELSNVLDSGTVFYDIGSQFGYFIEFALRAGVEPSDIHAFEADRLRWKDLMSEYADTGVHINNKRVSEETTSEKITIDSYASQRPPDVIKIDVEGAEAAVVSGMKDTLSSKKPIIYIEMHPTMLSDFGNSVEDVYNILQDNEYEIEAANHRKESPTWVPAGNESKVQSQKGGTYLIRAVA